MLFSDKETDKLPLRIVDGQSRSVPAQFRAAAFWPDGSVQWVLTDFIASVAGSKTADYYLEQTTAIFPPGPGLIIDDEDDYIKVDTGKIRFRISKTRFNFLDQLTLAGNKKLVASSEESGVFLVAGEGTTISSLGPPKQVTIEEKGPLRCVIRIRGNFFTSRGDIYKKGILAYEARIHAYLNQDFIRVFFTLENNGKYGYRHELHENESVQFSKLDFSLNLKLGADRRVESDGFSSTLASRDRFFLSQAHTLLENNDETENFSYVIKRNNSVEETGKRAEGWIHIHDGDSGVIGGIRYFWQNYPKTILFSKDTLTFGLWPQGGKWPPGGKPAYLMRGGFHKTYEMVFRFYQGKQADAEDFVKTFKKPLLALADLNWIEKTKALGLMAKAGLKSSDKQQQKAFDRYEQLEGCKVHLEDSEEQGFGEVPATTLYTARESRLEETDWYGWMDFGDIPWGGETGAGAYASGHYDWPYGLLLQYLRTGDYAFFSLGAEMVRHRMDIDQYHTERGSPWLANFQKNEFGNHDRDEDPWEPNPSHTWIQGLLLYYYLTGDIKSRDTALDVGRATEYYWTHGVDDNGKGGSDEIRIQGWSIENFLALYYLTNQRHYLDFAQKVYFQYTRRFISAQGYVGNPNNLNIFQPVLAVEPFIKLDREIDSNIVKDDLLRMIIFLKDEGYRGGIFNEEGDYQPLHLPYHFVFPSKIRLYPAGPYNLMMANAYAYAYMITGQNKYMEFARSIFRDFTFFWQVDDDFVDPLYPSAITFQALHFPGSLSKIHGWINRYPMIYLYAETHPKTDVVPPATIKDLEVRADTPSTVILDWTAPGDDGMVGKATSYQIKYSRKPLDSEMKFLAAKNISNNPLPQPAGALERFRLEGLSPGKMFFFAVRSKDKEQNQSSISNIAAIKLPQE